jgi:ligand-binding sensor domain-containing protein
MKRFIALLACLSNLLTTGISQNAGKWHSYLAYNNTTSVAEGNTLVYALADGSLYSFGKEDNSLRYYSKESGLNDNQIGCISFNSLENKLIIAYSNGNIDLASDDLSIYNLPFLLNSGSIQDKTIYSVYNDKGTAYLATAFGIVVLDVGKKEIKDTYKLNTSVSSVAILDNAIYALASNGSILKADMKDNLIDPANWYEYPVLISGGVKDTVLQLCVFQNSLCFLIKNKGIYYQAEHSMKQLLSHAALKNIKAENGKLIAFSANELFIYSSFTERDKGSIAGITDASSLKDNRTFWLATGEKGLTGIRLTGDNRYQILLENTANEGPKRNLNAFMRMHNQKLYVAGGGRWTYPFYRPGTVMVYDTDSLKWNNLKDISGFKDATCIAVDPKDDNHYFVSTWGGGLYEFGEGELLKRHDHTNSALTSIYPNTNDYTRVEGACFDKDGNLWMTNTEVPDVIVVLKADGSWTKLNYPSISNPTLADKILIASNGYKWVNLVRANQSGIFVFNDNGTIDMTSDDVSHYYSSLTDIQGNDIGANQFFCIAEDKKGQIWIGTNRGAFIVSAVSRAAEGSMTGSRIIHTDEYGNLQYFLTDERINAIAADGGNRKWLGTGNSGIYLVSEDGSEIVSHFTTDNSPLLSNTIESIAINDYTGEVFIGTDQGLISYMGDATKGSENYSNVYAYPNPVRPGSDERVVITGLMDNSNVKITDATGNLIYQGRSSGGQISWNCRNRNGNPVATGVYLVFSSTPEAKESVVTKIAIIKD